MLRKPRESSILIALVHLEAASEADVRLSDIVMEAAPILEAATDILMTEAILPSDILQEADSALILLTDILILRAEMKDAQEDLDILQAATATLQKAATDILMTEAILPSDILQEADSALILLTDIATEAVPILEEALLEADSDILLPAEVLEAAEAA
jgi:hypothetical protein